MMDKRIFVEKKADFQVKSEEFWLESSSTTWDCSSLKSIRIVQVYDVFDQITAACGMLMATTWIRMFSVEDWEN
nr:hypothetical protein [Haemophilus influenzae]